MIKTCNKCGKKIKVIGGYFTVKYWETCNECIHKDKLKNNCKRHGGKLGKNCSICKLEGRF